MLLCFSATWFRDIKFRSKLSNLIATQHVLLLKATKCVEVALPVRRVDACVADRISAVNHCSVAAVNPHMAHRPGRIVSPGKKDDVPRLCVRCGNRNTLVINPLCGCSWKVMHPAVGKYPTDKAGTVKTCGRA